MNYESLDEGMKSILRSHYLLLLILFLFLFFIIRSDESKSSDFPYAIQNANLLGKWTGSGFYKLSIPIRPLIRSILV